MDFAFAPGTTGYDGMLRQLYTNRSSTTLVTTGVASTIKGFIDHLKAPAVLPAVNLLVGTHGDDNAYMQAQWASGTGYSTNTYWEDLDRADTRDDTQIEDAVVITRPTDASGQPILPMFLIKGCRIAVSQPFMDKMKLAINGASSLDITVTAPRFYHYLNSVPGKGVFEAFEYDYKLISKTAITNKAALITALLAKNYTDIHGTAVTLADYNRWIPVRISRDKDPIQPIILNSSPVPRYTAFQCGRYRHTNPTILVFTISGGSFPAADPARITALRDILVAGAAAPGTNSFFQQLASTHEFPFYERYNYTDIDDMINNLTWTFTRSGSNWVATGKRHEYDVNPPIVESGNTNLIYNYYAEAGSGTSSLINFTDTDTRFYITT
ncbi:MAG: hypothetical protein ABW174_12645 [Flavitalea sp.]